MPEEIYEQMIPGLYEMNSQDQPWSPIVPYAGSPYKAFQRYSKVYRSLPPRRRKPRDWRMPTNYVTTIIKARYPDGIWTTQDVLYYDRRQAIGCLGPPSEGGPVRQPTYKGASDHGPLWFEFANIALKERAEIQAYLKLKEQKVNLGVMAGEARKTADHLGSSILNLGNAAMAVRKGRFKEAARRLGIDRPRKAPGKWLEWRYGWIPTLSDIKNSAEALAQSHTNPVGWQHCVKGVVREPWGRQGYNGSGAYRVMRMESGHTGAFVRFDVVPDNTFLSTLTSLGLTNPAEIAWELLPLSFVLDWLLPIGDWLSALDAMHGYDFRSGSNTLRSEGVGTAVADPLNTSAVRSVSPSYGGTAFCRKLHLVRSTYSGFPTPQYPRLRLGLNLKRVADGFSLLSQAFSRR